MEDVGCVSFTQLRPKGADVGEGPGDSALTLLALAAVFGEKGGGVEIRAGRTDEDPVDGGEARHDLPGEGGEASKSSLGIGVFEESADLWSVTHGDVFVIANGGDVE